MRIVMIMPFYGDDVLDPDELLDRYPLLRALPREVAALGHSVTVLVHAPFSACRDVDKVQYEFIRPSTAGEIASRAMHHWKPRYGPAYYAPITRLLARVPRLKPDCIHFFGLTLDIHLARILRQNAAPVVVHFHGGLPAASRRLRVLQRHNLTRLDKVLFTTSEQAEAWLASGLGLVSSQVATVLETSTEFKAIDRCVARAITGMQGDPVYLSTGRLDEIKDPLTLLRGFRLIHIEQPGARLYLYYRGAALQAEVDRWLAAHPDVAGAVVLRGQAAPQEMGAIYSSADVLLQASLREWSGLAVLEAMACGCVPVVTSIPSFVLMTGDGRYGRLFAPRDARAMARAALGISEVERRTLSLEVQRHFDEKLSFAALARDVEAIYTSLAAASP